MKKRSKKLNVKINYCNQCPYLSKTVYWYTCQKTKKSHGATFVENNIASDCPLQDWFVEENGEAIDDRFERLDL